MEVDTYYELELLLNVLPPYIKESLQGRDDLDNLIEIVLDLGRKPEARFPGNFEYLSDEEVSKDDLKYVTDRVSPFGLDNRSGIEKTLHRISAIKNRRDEIIGLTCRVGKTVFGTVDIIRDVIAEENSMLLLGKPGIGKTTMLRETSRILADEFNKRVVIVDTSNEIAGDGDIPHPGIGHARRMQVKTPEKQHDVMIEAVENHMPEVIIIDEIGTEKEADAAKTIAERGVQLIATAHGNLLENLISNPTLSELIGGVKSVTLGDEEAKKRNTQKAVLERKGVPTFDVVAEIVDRKTLKVHRPVDKVVDLYLRGLIPQPEIRIREGNTGGEIIQNSDVEGLDNFETQTTDEPEDLYIDDSYDMIDQAKAQKSLWSSKKSPKIYPYAISRKHIEKVINKFNIKASLTKHIHESDLMITVKAQKRKGTGKIKKAYEEDIPVYVIKKNNFTHVEKILRKLFIDDDENNDDETNNEIEANNDEMGGG